MSKVTTGFYHTYSCGDYDDDGGGSDNDCHDDGDGDDDHQGDNRAL